MKHQAIFFMTIFTAVTAGFFSFPEKIFAADNTVYVDKDASDGGDGSKGSPYKSIKKALEEANNGDSIKVAGGTYDDALTVEKEVEIVGAGRAKTNISGTILAKKKLELENLSVTAKNAVAITVEDGVSFKIENGEIKGFGRNGINAMPGKGKIQVIDSSIHNSRGKGVYAQKGRSIEIIGSRFYDNGEEALDIRNNVSGVIKNNAIYSNDEGGIEIIIGDSDVEIRNNKITKNKASGIAAQFYSLARRSGKIVIANNTINSNGKFGLDCNLPSGGNPPAGYWQRSLELATNVLEGNGLEEISPFCKIIEAVDTEEEKDNTITETNSSTVIPEASPANTLSAEDLKKEEQVWQEAEALTTNTEREARISVLRTNIQNQNKISRFFLGDYRGNLATLRSESAEVEKQVTTLRDLVSQTPSLQSDTSLQNLMTEQEVKLKEWKNFVVTEESHFSVYSSMRNLVRQPKKLLPLLPLF